MKCPRCSGTLKPTTLRELNLIYNSYTCTGCQGLWMGQERLKDIEITVDQQFFELRGIDGGIDQQKVLACPQCEGGVAMDKVISKRDDKVVMDVCPKCHNVWLDRGEREAIEQQSLIDLMGSFFGATK